MLDRNPLDPARKVGFPVGLGACNSVDRGTFVRSQIAVPPKVHQHLHGELGVAVLDLTVFGVDAFGQQVVAVPLNAETCAEGKTTISNRLRHIVEVGRTRVLHVGGAPARPWQTVVVPISGSTNGFERRAIKGVLVGHVEFDPLRALARVTDCPQTAVELTRDAFNVWRNFIFHLDVAEEAISKAELLRKQTDDFVVCFALEERVHNLVTPLKRTVGGRHRATCFELRTRGQQVNTIGTVVQNGRDGGVRVDNNQHVQLLHRGLHLDLTGLRVGRVAPEHHGTNVVVLVHVVLFFEDTIDPARHRNTREVLKRLFLAVGAGDGTELTCKPFGIFTPNAGPVPPSAVGQTVVAWQRVRQNTKVGCALHVVVAAENVGTATRRAHVAQRQLKHAICTCVVVTVGVLRATHTPNHGAGAVVCKRFSNAAQLLTGGAGYALDLFGCPFGHFVTDLVHAPNAGADELFVFPTVFEDVVQNTPNQRHVGTGTEANVLISVCRSPREARVANDDGCVVFFLRLQDVKQRNRVRFCGVGADHEDRFGVVDVVVRVRHGAVAPCVRNTSHSRGVTNTGLVIHVVRAPVGCELAEQVSLLVVVLGGAEPVNAVRAAFFADGRHAVADLVDRLFPANALPLTTLFFYGVFEAAFAVGVLTNRGPLGAMRTEVKGAVPAGLLPSPHTVGHFGHNGTTHRTVGADRFNGFNVA